MPLVLTVVDEGGDAFDVHVDADPDATVGAVAQALAHAGGRSPSACPALFVDGAAVADELPLRDSPLRTAAVVGLGCAVGPQDGEPGGLVEVRGVGGPGSGAVHRLDIGEYRVGLGRDGTPQIVRGSPDTLYALLRIGPGGRCTLLSAPPQRAARPYDESPGEAAQLDRAEFDGEQVWPFGAQLRVGDSLLELVAYDRPDAALERSEDGAGLDYNRPPRLLPPRAETRFRLPSPPPKPPRRPLPYFAAIMPLVMALAGVLIFDRVSFLLFGLLSPVAIVGNHLVNRRSGKETHAETVAEYEEKKARVERDADSALVAERTARRRDFPDPAAVLLTAVGPRRRLWERRRGDDDFLELRVGTADQPSQVQLEDPTLDEHRRTTPRVAYDMPVTVPLREHKVLGIAGQGTTAGATARWVVAQAAVLHSPRDLQIYVLSSGSDGEDSWAWLRWLPHVRRESGDVPANVGTDTESSARRVAELTALIAARAGASRDARATTREPDVLVVLDGARRLRSLPGVVQILRDGPAFGVHALCLDTEERLLPEECQAVVAEEPYGGGLRVALSRSATLDRVRPDLVPVEWCRSVARALGPLRDTGAGDDDGNVLPSAARLLDVLALDPPTPEAVSARWKSAGRTTSAVVGVSLDGPFALDLRRDGPHALVAGTTGSGKSELLQTIVASLAVGNRPDAMTFVLVDYKGGSAFKDCVDLPHTVGMVTDLDAHLVERALTSLSAELKRREHILAAAGAKDIEDYVDLLQREPDQRREPMPRLLIVIDEFASMVRDLPDFVKGLVNIAQRGRSLGIHLILATQRPGGVVSPEIRANTNLRIALRVTDSSESQDVINTPDAAAIGKNTPGRAYVRLGQTSLVPFQSGRVGGRRPGVAHTTAPVPWAVPLGWNQLGRPLPARPRSEPRDADTAVTDLADLVAAIREADSGLGIPAQHSPWLSALPTSLHVESLAPVAPGEHDDLTAASYGLVDLPAEQAQLPLRFDLGRLGHLHIIGSPRSGRSQTLRTLAGVLARAHPASDVHMYGIDCGNGALLALEGLPHCGAVAQHSQPERVARLVSRLMSEVARRQELLATHGATDLSELRRNPQAGERPPHLVLFLDRWEVFEKTLGEYDGGNLLNGMLALLRDGAGVGVHVVVAGDRSLFSSRLSSTTEDKLVLRLNDKAEYSMIGVNHRAVPDDVPPGRALRAGDKAEVQIALLDADAGGQAQAAALQAVGSACRERDAHLPASTRPFRVDVLPDRVSYAQAAAYLPDERPALWALAGIGGDELGALGPDLGLTPTFLVAGPPRSGRSTVLLALVRSLLDAGTPVVIAAPRRSPLRDLGDRPGVLALYDGADIEPEHLEEVLGRSPGGAVVVVDDADLLLKSRAEPVLNRLARTGAETGHGLVASGLSDRLAAGYSGWHTDLRRNRQGMLLSPQSSGDGDLIGVKIPRSRLGSARPGRAMMHLADGVLRTVQAPLTTLQDWHD